MFGSRWWTLSRSSRAPSPPFATSSEEAPPRARRAEVAGRQDQVLVDQRLVALDQPLFRRRGRPPAPRAVLGLGVLGEVLRGEGGAAEPVATGAVADEHQGVAGLLCGRGHEPVFVRETDAGDVDGFPRTRRGRRRCRRRWAPRCSCRSGRCPPRRPRRGTASARGRSRRSTASRVGRSGTRPSTSCRGRCRRPRWPRRRPGRRRRVVVALDAEGDVLIAVIVGVVAPPPGASAASGSGSARTAASSPGPTTTWSPSLSNADSRGREERYAQCSLQRFSNSATSAAVGSRPSSATTSSWSGSDRLIHLRGYRAGSNAFLCARSCGSTRHRRRHALRCCAVARASSERPTGREEREGPRDAASAPRRASGEAGEE